MKIIILLIILVINCLTQGAIDTDLLERCCMEGTRWASSNDRCDGYPRSVAQVRDDDQRSCRSILTVCCMKERQHLQCIEGQRSALDYTMCSIRDDVFGSEQFMECCHCCQLGLTSRSMNGDCNLLNHEEFGGPCDEVFHDCCSGGNDTDVNDINECDLYPGQLCSHICRNTQGSYRCECRPGFFLHTDGSTCLATDAGVTCEVYNPCQHRCITERSGGTTGVRCACDSGFQLASDEVSCEDVDECRLGRSNCPRQTRCVNTEGGFICEPYQQDCPQGQEFNPSTGSCQTVQQECDPGYGFNVVSQRCEDLDECTVRMHDCRGPRQFCVNTVGSYKCHCDLGFRYDRRTRSCYDIDECAIRRNRCTITERCENTIGSYNCRRILGCGTGYTLQEETQQCVDIDECDSGTHNCEGPYRCVNIDGSFRCIPQECPEGYRFSVSAEGCEPIRCSRGLKPDRRGMCVDDNECDRENDCSFTQRCVNTYGSYSCEDIMNCQAGFAMNPTTFRCEDVDECARGTHNCFPEQNCLNRPGSFICSCPAGFRFDGIRNCLDVNECAGGTVCPPNSSCLNTQGSFTCECDPGFQNDGPRRCIDVNECAGGTACPPNSSCLNTQGSFTCECNPGLQKDGRRCIDVDECQDNNRCQHNCVNLVGSYQCTCRFGYRLANDGRTCEDIDECTTGRGRACGGQCINTPGSYRCSCPEGWRSRGSGRSCQDIDECAEGTSRCQGPDTMCFNTRGSYKCPAIRCPSGFVRTPIGPRGNSVRCKRISFTCRQNDQECLTAPISLSYNFLSFPNNIKIPSDLFAMSGPRTTQKVFDWELEVVNVRPAHSGVMPVNRGYFDLKVGLSEAVVSLNYPIPGPQDIELQLNMKITDQYTGYTGRAISKIYLYVTSDDIVAK